MAIGEEGGGGGPSAGIGIGLGSSKQKGTTTTKLFNIEDLESLRALISGEMLGLPGAQAQFSKEAALSDSAGLVEGLARQLQERLLPQIGAQETLSGAYDSTSRGQLNNDLISRVAEQAAGLQLQTVKDYAQMQQLQFQPLLELFGLLKGADSVQKTKQKGKSKGLNLGFGL